jgi:hypothetical protein
VIAIFRLNLTDNYLSDRSLLFSKFGKRMLAERTSLALLNTFLNDGSTHSVRRVWACRRKTFEGEDFGVSNDSMAQVPNDAFYLLFDIALDRSCVATQSRLYMLQAHRRLL